MNQSLPIEATESSNLRRHWPASLELCFGLAHQRTRILAAAHHGPLRVQRLFHPASDGGKAHCYLLHPPGGVVLGDELTIRATLKSGAVLLTTPSAGRFYSVASHREMQQQRVILSADDGLLEWLPQETILFPGARAVLDTRIEIGEHARLAYWDVLVLGRPACGERFDTGGVEQRLSIHRGARLRLHERLALQAGDRLTRALPGLRDASTVGIAIFTATPPEALLEAWLAAANGDALTGAFSVTQREEFVVARYLGEDAQRCRAGFADLWRGLTEARDGTAPSTPRIWHT